MARISTTKAYDNKDVIIQINDLKNAVADLGQGIVIATEMPTAVAAYLDKVYLYIGDTDETYRENNIYKCIETGGAYAWELMEVTAGTGATWGTIQGALSDQTDLQSALSAKAAATEVTSHIGNTLNPHRVTKAQVGLSNADNTSDLNKPVSTAMQSALDAKASASALTAHIDSTENPHSVTKAQVGLGNVDNTSDADKPISTAVQSALNGKQASVPGTDKSGKYLKVGTSGEIEYSTVEIPESGPALSDTAPAALGTASAGTAAAASRADHVHALPTLAELGAQATLTFDTTPTDSSANPVTSDGIIRAMQALYDDIENSMYTPTAYETVANFEIAPTDWIARAHNYITMHHVTMDMISLLKINIFDTSTYGTPDNMHVLTRPSGDIEFIYMDSDAPTHTYQINISYINISSPWTSYSLTLSASGWTNKEQTLAATGMTSSSDTEFTSADIASLQASYSGGVDILSTGTDTITFNCNTVPTVDINVHVIRY